MGLLNGKTAYLAGDMSNWRDLLTPRLMYFGLIPIDPAKHELNTLNEHQRRNHFRREGDWLNYQLVMRAIRQTDLDLVRSSNMLIANLDTEIPLAGTYEELSLATQLQKPTFIICPKPKILPWIFGVIDLDHTFDDIEDLIWYLCILNDN